MSAQPLSLPGLPPTAVSAKGAGARSESGAAGFAKLDDRVMTGARGTVVVRATARADAWAVASHVTRRTSGAGLLAISARARAGAPLWREVGAQLGLGATASDPARCAREVQQALVAQRAVLVAELPAPGSWDRLVACELAAIATGMVVFVSATPDAAADLSPECFEVGSALDPDEASRWWSAVAEHAAQTSPAADLASLDEWWGRARPQTQERGGQASRLEGLDASALSLLGDLALAGCGWPVSDLAMLHKTPAEGALAALTQAGSLQVERGGWVTIAPAWDDAAEGLVHAADASTVTRVAGALLARFPTEAWARLHAAELLVRAGSADAADEAIAGATALVDDTAARRELVSRWVKAVQLLPAAAQLPLRTRAAERALDAGEAEEAFRWAQSAAAIAPESPAITLLFGRAAVAMGDLVAARVALERGRAAATDPEMLAQMAVELGEISYLKGDLAGASREAEGVLDTGCTLATRLRARNILGKILLAQAKWDEADQHFAEDTWMASSSGLVTPELRARLNRGIALLSKGQLDEARSIFDAVLSDGERLGDARACAFALDNLAVLAALRHRYAQALALNERTLRIRQRLGDRLTTARVLANVADLRRRLGLLDHAEHALAFGRRTLGPGTPPARSARFCIVAAKIALARGNTSEARREVARAITDFEAAGLREYVGEAHRLSARIALDDGDLARAGSALAAARDLSTTDEGRAEVALLTAIYSRAVGDNDERLAGEALALARVLGEEELLLEAHKLLSEVHRTNGNLDGARAHIDQAIALRDQVAETLSPDVRAAFLARADVVALSRLQAALTESSTDLEPPSQRAGRAPRGGQPLLRELVGEDPAIRALHAAVRKIAHATSTVLIRGESGTGKELVAEAIHRASDRASGPLVTVNCAALVESLLLSELFGHEKGAFTGATARRRGRFELAEGGTLFLDEIGDISPRTQVALLRVLQERTFERVGGTTPLRANVRIICATHRDLKAMVERGEFREDLYYRLRGITLELPPLRHRMGDLPRIADNLLARIALERGDGRKTLSADALELLGRHRWPGNVRELENTLRAASLFAEGETITAACLVDNVDELRGLASAGPLSARQPPQRPSYLPPPPSFLEERATRPPEEPGGSRTLRGPGEGVIDGAPGEDGEDEGFCGELPTDEANATAVAYAQVRQGQVSLSDLKRQIERDCIARALAETRGNITRAAALLGMKRPRLSQLVKQYGISAVSSEASS